MDHFLNSIVLYHIWYILQRRHLFSCCNQSCSALELHCSSYRRLQCQNSAFFSRPCFCWDAAALPLPTSSRSRSTTRFSRSVPNTLTAPSLTPSRPMPRPCLSS